MLIPPDDVRTPQSVSVDHRGGRWVVTITAPEGYCEREFTVEAFARSFAEGQRYRLGLALAE